MEDNVTDQFPEGAAGDHQVSKRCQVVPGEKNRLPRGTVAWCNIPHLGNHK